jgi:NAD+ kinase
MIFKKVALFSKKQNNKSLSTALKKIVKFLHTKKIQICFVGSSADIMQQTLCSIDKINCDCNLIVSLGGDGTLLSAARHFADLKIPIVGVNIGHLGFLVDVPYDDKFSQLDKILQGEYKSENRLMLSATVVREKKIVFDAISLNDIVIRIKNTVKMIEFKTYINNIFVNNQRADGLIINTPSGSTAYALSSGGSILSAGINAVQVLPICPHTLSSRPIVINADDKIKVVYRKRNKFKAHVVADGYKSFDLMPQDEIHIQKSKHDATLIHPIDHDSYSILREKLNWG